jgi:hypothetical protein
MFQETDKKFQETDKKIQETDRIVKNLSKQLGDLSNRLGEFVEHAVAPAVSLVTPSHCARASFALRCWRFHVKELKNNSKSHGFW